MTDIGLATFAAAVATFAWPLLIWAALYLDAPESATNEMTRIMAFITVFDLFLVCYWAYEGVLWMLNRYWGPS